MTESSKGSNCEMAQPPPFPDFIQRLGLAANVLMPHLLDSDPVEADKHLRKMGRIDVQRIFELMETALVSADPKSIFREIEDMLLRDAAESVDDIAPETDAPKSAKPKPTITASGCVFRNCGLLWAFSDTKHEFLEESSYRDSVKHFKRLRNLWPTSFVWLSSSRAKQPWACCFRAYSAVISQITKFLNYISDLIWTVSEEQRLLMQNYVACMAKAKFEELGSPADNYDAPIPDVVYVERSMRRTSLEGDGDLAISRGEEKCLAQRRVRQDGDEDLFT
ncbi:hypothetical protein IWZ03DRAFT_232747 [Phyllosticta citriasiana]|uniref:Uncharacterized protein n=2 Tax=Phyllosticta citriasiana TaxID=595635 RepID=A0ABR1KL08_9PEZI